MAKPAEARPEPPRAEPEECGGLCHRCEHRIQFIETQGRHRPRFECGDIAWNEVDSSGKVLRKFRGGSKYACYMFQPVKPVILGRLHSEKVDPRPVSLNLLSARVVRIGLGEHMHLWSWYPDARKQDKLVYWKPDYRRWWSKPSDFKNRRFRMEDPALKFQDVKGCARCGRNHRGLVFRKLDRPAGVYSWWATCPYTGEPVLMRILKNGGGKCQSASKRKVARPKGR